MSTEYHAINVGEILLTEEEYQWLVQQTNRLNDAIQESGKNPVEILTPAKYLQYIVADRIGNSLLKARLSSAKEVSNG